MTNRICVTGLGVISPVGSGRVEFWKNICDGRGGARPIQSFDSSLFDTHHGGEVPDFVPERYFRFLDPTKVPRTTQLAVAAASMAWTDAGLPTGRDRVGICFGTTMGNQSVVEAYNDSLRNDSSEARLPAATYPATFIAHAIATELETSGPFLVLPTACAAGNYAIGWGFELIRSGRAEIVVAGGSDAMSRGCYAVFNGLRAITPDICRPFDLNRRGILVSEGSAALVLESERSARARGAMPYAELVSYGLSCDAYHPTAPHPEGAGAARAMVSALKNAECKPTQVSYISAHGTGTKANDATESRAVRVVFGEHTDTVPVSSIKSVIGHTMGAASAIEAVSAVLAIRHGVLPPTMNYVDTDPECLSNVVPNIARNADVELVLSNSFGFGGNIATILLRKLAPWT